MFSTVVTIGRVWAIAWLLLECFEMIRLPSISAITQAVSPGGDSDASNWRGILTVQVPRTQNKN